MGKVCKSCGKEFEGRSDKVFCCDLCRTHYHNERRREVRNSGGADVKILLRNRRLIAAYLASGLRKVPVSRLLGDSFELSCYTSRSKRAFRPAVYHCFEYSYSLSRRGVMKIRPTKPPLSC